MATGAALLLGSFDAMATTIRHAAVQIDTPDELRGRVTAFYQMSSRGGPAIGDTRMGAFAGVVGPVFALDAPAEELSRRALAGRFVLVEGSPRILPEVSEELGGYTLEQLRKRDIEIFLSTFLSSCVDGHVVPDGQAVDKAREILNNAKGELPTLIPATDLTDVVPVELRVEPGRQAEHAREAGVEPLDAVLGAERHQADRHRPVDHLVLAEQVDRGASVRLDLEAIGRQHATLWTRAPGESWRPQGIELDSAGRASRVVGPLRSDLHARLTSGSRSSDTVLVQVRLPVFLGSLTVTARYPRYLGLEDEPVPPVAPCVDAVSAPTESTPGYAAGKPTPSALLPVAATIRARRRARRCPGTRR